MKNHFYKYASVVLFTSSMYGSLPPCHYKMTPTIGYAHLKAKAEAGDMDHVVALAKFSSALCSPHKITGQDQVVLAALHLVDDKGEIPQTVIEALSKDTSKKSVEPAEKK